MKILEVPYFAYETKAWDSRREEIVLPKDIIDTCLEMLESGTNLFEIFPSVKENIRFFGLEHAFFEKRREIHIDGECFISKKEPRQIGKLLIPHYNIISRDEIKLLQESSTEGYGKGSCTRALLKFPDIELFRSMLGEYSPFDSDKMLVLSKKQLE